MGQVAHQAVEVSMGGLKRGCESEMKRRMEEGRKDWRRSESVELLVLGFVFDRRRDEIGLTF